MLYLGIPYVLHTIPQNLAVFCRNYIEKYLEEIVEE